MPVMEFVVKGAFRTIIMRFKCVVLKDGCMFWQKATISLSWASQLNHCSIIYNLPH